MKIGAKVVEYWAINADSVIDLEFSMEASRPPRVGVNDNVVFFRRTSADVEFFATSQVIAQKRVTEGEITFLYVTLSEPREFEEVRLLSDFTYSLTIISRFGSPGKHFTRDIRKLPTEDYDALLAGVLFWSRSAFGNLINALPSSRVVDFVNVVGQDSQSLLTEGPDFRVLWPLLRDWVHEEYVEPHLYFEEIRRIAEDLEDTGFSLESTRIQIDDGKMSGSVSSLGRFLAAFAQEVSPQYPSGDEKRGSPEDVETRISVDLWDAINERIEENSTVESQFHKRFAKYSWPLIRRIRI